MKVSRWRLVFEFETNCLHEEPGTLGGMPSLEVVLRDPNLYLPEYRRKPRKTLNGYVDKRDQKLNPRPSSTNLSLNHSATGKA